MRRPFHRPTGLLVTVAVSVAPFGMPSKSTVTRSARHEGTLEGFLKGQRNHLSVSICAPGSDGSFALTSAFHSNLDVAQSPWRSWDRQSV